MAPITLLIKKIQGKAFDIIDVPTIINSSIETLDLQYVNGIGLLQGMNKNTKNYRIRELLDFGGYYLQEFLNNCFFDPANYNIASYTLPGTFKQIDLQYEEEELFELRKIVAGVSQFLKVQLQNGVPDAKSLEGVILKGLKNINFEQIIKLENKHLLIEYGNNDILNLLIFSGIFGTRIVTGRMEIGETLYFE